MHQPTQESSFGHDLPVEMLSSTISHPPLLQRINSFYGDVVPPCAELDSAEQREEPPRHLFCATTNDFSGWNLARANWHSQDSSGHMRLKKVWEKTPTEEIECYRRDKYVETDFRKMRDFINQQNGGREAKNDAPFWVMSQESCETYDIPG